MAKDLEPGTLAHGARAYREYELFVPNAPDATVAITLGDLEQDTPAARFARKSGATHYGLVAILNVPHAPDYPFVWSLRETILALTSSHIGTPVDGTLRQTIGRLLGVFFHEIRAIAPELSEMKLTVANDASPH